MSGQGIKRRWLKGPPPHIGWWNASTSKNIDVWRWWNGRFWSRAVAYCQSPKRAGQVAKMRTKCDINSIRYTTSWPENARVPRINPNKEMP